MTEKQLKELIREEYHNVKDFMEEKYGFTPELGKVIDNPYASTFKNESDSTDESLSDYEKKGAKYDKIYKGYKYKKKKSKKNEGGDDSEMAVSQLNRSLDYAQMLIGKLRGKGDLEPWVQSYITKAEDYLNTTFDYYKGKEGEIQEYDVENEQDIKEFAEFMREYKSDINEAEYQGRDVKLGKIMQGDVKKFKVYVKNPKGNVVKVNFGQKGMTIKKDNPGARKSFRARMNCDSPGPRHKARYWSCRKW